MDLQKICENYFNGCGAFATIWSHKRHTCSENTAATIKIVSYATLICPIIMGMIYCATLLGRCKRGGTSALDRTIQDQAQSRLVRSVPSPDVSHAVVAAAPATALSLVAPVAPTMTTSVTTPLPVAPPPAPAPVPLSETQTKEREESRKVVTEAFQAHFRTLMGCLASETFPLKSLPQSEADLITIYEHTRDYFQLRDRIKLFKDPYDSSGKGMMFYLNQVIGLFVMQQQSDEPLVGQYGCTSLASWYAEEGSRGRGRRVRSNVGDFVAKDVVRLRKAYKSTMQVYQKHNEAYGVDSPKLDRELVESLAKQGLKVSCDYTYPASVIDASR